MDNENITASIEAIIFASPVATDILKLSSILDISIDQIKDSINQIKASCDKENRGITLVCKGNNYQFITKKEYAQIIAKYITNRKSVISNAAMETLAITAYNQPVTKTYISQIRGVSSGEIIDALEIKGLIAQAGKLDLPGKPMSYVTTDKFLTVFNLTSIKDLPEIDFIGEDIMQNIPHMTHDDITDEQTNLVENIQ